MIGTRIGDYVIKGELSANEMQHVYSAVHVLLPRHACITVAAASREAALPMMRAGCVLEALHHAGVPRVYECGVIGRRPWIATELVDGETLAERLGHGVMSVESVARLVRDAAEILAHAHRRGVCHTALSANLIVYGTARRIAPLCIVGWHHARCGDPVDGSDDVRALGTIAYQALTADAVAGSAEAQLPGVPVALTRLIDRMRSADPAVRPTADQLRSDAVQVLDRLDQPVVDDGSIEIPIVDIELVDIARRPPAAPRGRWTPDTGYTPPPITSSSGGAKPRGKNPQG